jgi:predicted porin
MKNKVIALAVMGALAMPVSGYAAEKKNDGTPTVYGKVHLSYGALEEIDSGVTTVDEWALRSHASRFGIKGQRDISDSLAVTYKFEWQIDYEQGEDAGLDRRNMYGGLKGGFGEFRFGRHDTPLKMAQGKFDQFNDTDGDIKNAGDEDGENRLDNILMYLGKTGGFVYQLAWVPGEGDTNNDNGPADTISAAFGYSKGPLHLMVAHDSYANDAAAAEEDSLTRFVATYKFSGIQIGALAQSGVEGPDTAAAKEDWIGASLGVKVGSNGKIKAQYIMVEDSRPQPLESTQVSVGYDHKLDKKTKIYAMYTNLDEDDTSGTTDDLEKSFLGVGFIYKF